MAIREVGEEMDVVPVADARAVPTDLPLFPLPDGIVRAEGAVVGVRGDGGCQARALRSTVSGATSRSSSASRFAAAPLPADEVRRRASGRRCRCFAPRSRLPRHFPTRISPMFIHTDVAKPIPPTLHLRPVLMFPGRGLV